MQLTVFQNYPCEDAATVGDAFQALGWHLEVVRCWEAAGPPVDNPGDALLVLGGPMNVDEVGKHPFLTWQTAWIREWALAGRPLLGLCLGAQLLSKSLGGHVQRNPVPEIGHFTVILTPEGRADPLFEGFDREFQVVQWHGDTFSIPAGATRLAASTLCSNQALRYGHAVGVQFHLEIGRTKMATWITEYAGDPGLRGVDINRMLRDFHQRETAYALTCRRLVENFLRHDCAAG